MIYLIEKDVYSLQDYFNTIEDTNVTLQDFIETVSKDLKSHCKFFFLFEFLTLVSLADKRGWLLIGLWESNIICISQKT